MLVSSADETAFEVRDLLAADPAPPGRAGTQRFLSSGDPDRFVAIGSPLLGAELATAERIEWA